MASFGERMQTLRKQKNVTQKQIAEHFSLTERAYQRYEGDASTPHFHVLLALAEYFDVSLDYLVGRNDNPDSHKSQ